MYDRIKKNIRAVTYEKYFKSHRADGRIPSAQAAFMEMMRRQGQELSLPKELTKESFLLWSEDVEADAQALEHMPWDKRGSLEMNLHFNLYQKARAFYILKVPKGFLL